MKNKKKILVLIPTRLNSRRLPAKALLPINNLPLIMHVYKRVKLSKKVNELESFKQKLIISQCKSGGRSAQAQMFLKRLGFEKVLNLSGGILKYRGQTS